jgi:hypothetical protein
MKIKNYYYKYMQRELKVSSFNRKLDIFDLVKDKHIPFEL